MATTNDPNKPIQIVIMGRPNVGKSSLFNRLIGKRKSLVHDFPGVTRDRIEERTSWWHEAKEFPVLVIDTGGLGGERFAEEINAQVNTALECADIALLVFDAREGLTAADREVLEGLRRANLGIPVIGVANKVDVPSLEHLALDFAETGLEEVLPCSAESGRGVPTLQERCIEISGHVGETFTEESQSEDSAESEIPKIAIVGKPNVGKSTLVNALANAPRVVTSPIPGTTVDSIDLRVTIAGKEFDLIDTAGIRRKGKTDQGVEVLSVVQTIKALERCDVALLVLDGEEGAAEQDEKIGGLIEKAGCGVIIIVNKWDTQERNHKFSPDEAAERIRRQFAFLKYAPILFASGLKKKGLESIGEVALEIIENRKLKVPTKEFSDFIRTQSETHNPHNAKFYMCHQASRVPPTFVCHVNDPKRIDFSLKRNLINGIRTRWGFMGSPVRILFKKSINNSRATR